MFDGIPSLRNILMMVVAFFTALTVHEYAHARAALAQGDDTAKLAGRISLNPIDHLDPLGTVMFFMMMLTSGIGLAWGKPVPVNPYRFRSPRWGNLSVSAWGPLSNILFAAALAVLLRFVVSPLAPGYRELVIWCILTNLGLAFLNMIPVPPLDGSKVLSSLLPYAQSRRYEYFMARYGMLIFLGIIFTGVTHYIIWPPISFVFNLLV